jgi:hypothetical protein
MTDLTQAHLKELLHYDPDTGVFTWKDIKKNRHLAGKMAGNVSVLGYVIIKINQKYHKAHRLAWLYEFGQFPEKWIDHINRDRSDNRIANLRNADHSLNMRNKKIGKNNKSSKTGVSFSAATQKWSARIQVKNKSGFLGWFSNLEDAIASREKAEIDWGYHLDRPTTNVSLNRALWHLTQEFAKLKGQAIAA